MSLNLQMQTTKPYQDTGYLGKKIIGIRDICGEIDEIRDIKKTKTK